MFQQCSCHHQEMGKKIKEFKSVHGHVYNAFCHQYSVCLSFSLSGRGVVTLGTAVVTRVGVVASGVVGGGVVLTSATCSVVKGPPY